MEALSWLSQVVYGLAGEKEDIHLWKSARNVRLVLSETSSRGCFVQSNKDLGLGMTRPDPFVIYIWYLAYLWQGYSDEAGERSQKTWLFWHPHEW